MIGFSMDIDWASEPVISYCLDIFRREGIKCTLFATHDSSVIRSAEKEFFEIGIHPNFNPVLKGQGGSAEQVIDDLLAIYPNSKGARSHSLTQSGLILELFKQKGLLYECNHFLPYHNSLRPYILWNDLIRIPFNWEDDYHFALGKTFDEPGVELVEEGLTVFNFHPVHIFMNTENYPRYFEFRNIINKYEELFPFINKSEVKGTRDMLIFLLKMVKEKKLLHYFLNEIAQTAKWK